MKVDTQPFPGVNMVESYDRSAKRQLDFTLGINMAGVTSRHQVKNKESQRSAPKRRERICHRRASKVCEESMANFF
jgi:hypothetical protein